MNIKSNQILIGVIVVLIGMFSLMKSFIKVDYSAMTLIVMGLAFLLLYRTKRRSWPLFVGGYMTYFGLAKAFLLSTNFFGFVQMIAGMFFIVPGAIFMVLYYDKNKRGLLVPASILLWQGAALIIVNALHLGIFGVFGVIVMCFGLSLCTVYIIGRYYISKGLLYFGAMFMGIGALMTGGILKSISIIKLLPKLPSYVLVVLGLLIILNTIRKKD